VFPRVEGGGRRKIILQVKGGGVKRGDVATLLATALFLWA